MLIETTCHYCKNKFNAEKWQSGECPYCHERYYWESNGFIDDYGFVVWEREENEDY